MDPINSIVATTTTTTASISPSAVNNLIPLLNESVNKQQADIKAIEGNAKDKTITHLTAAQIDKNAKLALIDTLLKKVRTYFALKENESYVEANKALVKCLPEIENSILAINKELLAHKDPQTYVEAERALKQTLFHLESLQNLLTEFNASTDLNQINPLEKDKKVVIDTIRKARMLIATSNVDRLALVDQIVDASEAKDFGKVKSILKLNNLHPDDFLFSVRFHHPKFAEYNDDVKVTLLGIACIIDAPLEFIEWLLQEKADPNFSMSYHVSPYPIEEGSAKEINRPVFPAWHAILCAPLDKQKTIEKLNLLKRYGANVLLQNENGSWWITTFPLTPQNLYLSLKGLRNLKEISWSLPLEIDSSTKKPTRMLSCNMLTQCYARLQDDTLQAGFPAITEFAMMLIYRGLRYDSASTTTSTIHNHTFSLKDATTLADQEIKRLKAEIGEVLPDRITAIHDIVLHLLSSVGPLASIIMDYYRWPLEIFHDEIFERCYMKTFEQIPTAAVVNTPVSTAVVSTQVSTIRKVFNALRDYLPF